MRRRLRIVPRPAARTSPGRRGLSMVVALVVLLLLYSRAKDPATWRWLAPEAKSGAGTAGARDTDAASAAVTESIVPGPSDLDREERDEAERQFQAVTDRTPLTGVDMPTYWRFMRWSRSQPLAEMEQRAAPAVKFACYFEEAEDYRGRLIRMRLHVRRVLKYTAPKNTAGVETVYEIWGWTDDSLSHPLVVVTSELPARVKIGPEVRAEAVFAGYFLKTMSYEADKVRSAPLLIGKIRTIRRAVVATSAIHGLPRNSMPEWGWVWFAAIAGVAALLGWWWNRREARVNAPVNRTDLPELDLGPEDEPKRAFYAPNANVLEVSDGLKIHKPAPRAADPT